MRPPLQTVSTAAAQPIAMLPAMPYAYCLPPSAIPAPLAMPAAYFGANAFVQPQQSMMAQNVPQPTIAATDAKVMKSRARADGEIRSSNKRGKQERAYSVTDLQTLLVQCLEQKISARQAVNQSGLSTIRTTLDRYLRKIREDKSLVRAL